MVANLTADFNSPDLLAQAHDITRRQMQQWFDWMDRVLDIHRSNFVFREPTAAELKSHETVIGVATRTCKWMSTLIANPDFDSEMQSRLSIRMKQLEDAYNTFHDPGISEEKANQVLRQVFPE
jgi:hypothetical protein